MILSPPFPCPSQNADVQEAESIRYGGAPFMVLPLKSGRIAVLGFQRALHSICDTFEEAIASAETIEFSANLRRMEAASSQRLAQKKEAPAGLPDLDLSDLNL